MKTINDVLKYLPLFAAGEVASMPENILCSVQEIRLRSGRNIILHTGGGYIKLKSRLEQKQLQECFVRLSSGSVYAFTEEITAGFITLPGGHRAGICGTAVFDSGKLINIKNISGINLRIAKEVRGCASDFCTRLLKQKNCSALIISPPKCGKTTFLRDIAANLGSVKKVCIIDERDEIAACRDGVPQLDVGEMTDVLSLCPKSIGIETVLRSMSPDIIITDELSVGDSRYINKIFSCGSNIIASAHGDDIVKTLKRLELVNITEQLGLVALLANIPKTGSINALYTGEEVYKLCLGK